MYNNYRITAVIPALNEQRNVGLVVQALLDIGNDIGRVIDEVVVCDNGSTDATALVARAAGATVVQEPHKGYGAACLKAISAISDTDYVLFLNGDGAENCSEIESLLLPLVNGYDLVIGSRELGVRQPGALSIQQRFGNKLASFLIRYIWQQRCTDLGPFRAIRYDCLKQIDMKDRDFGWTVEMQMKAYGHGYRVTEVPVTAMKTTSPSNISGTIKGSLLAGWKILSTIVILRLAMGRVSKQSLHTEHK